MHKVSVSISSILRTSYVRHVVLIYATALLCYRRKATPAVSRNTKSIFSILGRFYSNHNLKKN